VRRGSTGLCGLLLVDKPAGMTSHDVVVAVRQATGEGRVGHAGTLDPAATGLLVVLIGAYTRLAPYLTAARKRYEARIVFGVSTDTDDAEGDAVETAPVPDALFDAASARDVLASMLGASRQVPPAYSAIKIAGRASHRVARAGGVVDLAPRDVTVFDAQILEVDPLSHSWDVAFDVSKGTYVRSLARDLGRKAGTVAHLAALRRTASGPLRVEAAETLRSVIDAAGAGRLASLFADPVTALGLPSVEGDPADVGNGRALPRSAAEDVGDGERVAVLCDRRLKAVYLVAHDALRAEAVFPEEAA